MKEPEGWADVGERVRESRVAAGMSQEQLASALRLDRTMIAKIERGVRRVDALELAKLASVLKVPLSHFLSPPPLVVSRRTELADDTVTDATRQSYRLEAALSAWLTDIRQLMEIGEFSPPEIDRYPGAVQDASSARHAALWVRNRLGLGFDPIDSLMSVCERLGQLVAVVDAPGEGASLVEDDLAVAVISRQGDPGRRRATAAHELGHLIVGDEYSTDIGVHVSRDGREAVIDAFAAELLLPAGAFRSVTRSDGPAGREDLLVLAARFRTSWSLTVRQAVEAEAVDRNVAKEMRRRNPTRAELMEAVGWAPQPDLETVRVPPGYAHAVVESFKKSLITASRAVELMRGQIVAADLPLHDDADLEL
ncbi:helix-turn-helix domain-containing protein [Planomonospora sp. ID91781]|uniref:helix-turn-helix domain-containing protein n=1 Tax=Planomonospora sp. ID91781 TaxID=2738135 RepID=UPI0018C387B5|nr:XRE family transcriptional regulator [Planomonospora sp. ID91781]MBG0819713.1 helix-turn-helix domain-containing protein [Planomonospora sp. ID91781]